MKRFFQRDIEVLKTLSRRQQLEYIWDYYRWYILAAILTVFVLFHGAYLLWLGQKPYRLRVSVVLNNQDVGCA